MDQTYEIVSYGHCNCPNPDCGDSLFFFAKAKDLPVRFVRCWACRKVVSIPDPGGLVEIAKDEPAASDISDSTRPCI